ncbi:MAG: hypothetical protein ACF8LL_01680 [Phycisphaerales bacterium]
MTESPTVRVVCRQCRNALTTPLFIMSSPDQIYFDRDDVVFRQNLIATAHELRRSNGERMLPKVFPFDWVVRNDSVTNCSADEHTFGCCGHTPGDGPNLNCRCGTPVGWEWSDCMDVAYTIFDNRVTFVETVKEK